METETTCLKQSCQREEQCDDCYLVDHLKKCKGCTDVDHIPMTHINTMEEDFKTDFPDWSWNSFEWFGDGHFCRHHPDDPAHGPECYDHPYKEQVKHFTERQVAAALQKQKEAMEKVKEVLTYIATRNEQHNAVCIGKAKEALSLLSDPTNNL